MTHQGRAFSILEIKSLKEDERIVEGIASSPRVDRMGDIVEPLGAQFSLPMPLLLDHKSDLQVGHVEYAKATKDGIKFRARIAKVEEPGLVKDLVDKAWHLVKYKLRSAVSIGFRAMEDGAEMMKSGGIRFTNYEWMELSLVVIPAQADAVIQNAKGMDDACFSIIQKSLNSELRAASGRKQDGDSPGVSGRTDHLPVVKSNPDQGKTEMKTIAEQIKSFEETRSLKAAEMAEIMEKSAESGETLDAEQAERYDTLETEVKSIDTHLKRLRTAESLQAASAKAAAGEGAKASESRVPAMHTMVKSPKKADPGVRFARVVKCLGMAQGNWMAAAEVAKSVYGERDPGLVNTIKSNVTAGSTLSGNWAEDLVGDETSAFSDFVEYLRPMTILGKFGNGGIPSLRRVPFRVPLVGQTAGGAGYWVGEGQAKPLTAFDFSRTTLEPLKVANIAVLTMEVLRDSSPSAELIVRDQLAAALQARMDADFIDPAKSASSGVSPASILNGISAIPSTGNTADAIREDMRLLFASFIAANNAPTSGVWIMTATTALALSMMVNALGQSEFPGITMNGGTLGGLPVITSEYVPTPSEGSYVALVNAQDIYLGDDGGIAVDMSREASLQMLDNPTNDSVTPTATTMVSMFQTNSVAFRAERSINWARRRTSAVAYLSGVNWGQP